MNNNIIYLAIILLFITILIGGNNADNTPMDNILEDTTNECTLCFFIGDKIELLIKQNNTINQNTINQTLVKDCSNTYEYTKYEEICLDMVNEYTVKIINYINQKSNIYFICQQLLHLCGATTDSSDDSYTGAFTTSPMTSDIETSPNSGGLGSSTGGEINFKISLQ